MLTEMNKKDSDEINFFHGIHSGRRTSDRNYRDATKSTLPEGSRNLLPWKKSPTTIDTPRNRPLLCSTDPGNPFRGMSSRPHQASNPVSSRTVVRNVHKRRKVDSVARREMGSSHVQSNEVTIVEDEDPTLSSDPIGGNLRGELDEKNHLSSKPDRPFNPQRRPSNDGPEYKRLKEKRKPVPLAPETDDIESADENFGPDRIKPPLPLGVKEGHVARTAQSYGARNIIFEKPQKPGVAKNMKCKNRNPQPNTTTSLKPPRLSSSAALPIEEIYIGRMLISCEDGKKSLKLARDGTNLLIRERMNETLERTLMALEVIDSCSYSPWKQDQSDAMPEKIFLDIRILKGSRLEEFYPYFIQGIDDQRGSITVKISTSHPDWSGEIYGDFLERIKSRRPNKIEEVLNGKVLWEIAARDGHYDFEDTDHQAGKSKPESNGQISPDANDIGHSLDELKPRMSIKKPNMRDIGKPGKRSPSGQTSTAARRSTRLAVQDCAKVNEPTSNSDELILVYPPGVSGAVNITMGDLARLQPDEFLNDTLIEFGLKLWHSSLHPEVAETIHVFSSFFYKKLATGNIDDGYQSVRKWTSKIDIFKKKYIIVPINENLHWYLAIIDHPEHTLNPPVLTPPANTRSRAKLAEAQNAKISISTTPDDLVFPGELSVGSTPSEDRDLAEVVEVLNDVTPTSPVEILHPKTVQIALDKQPDEDFMIVDSQDETAVLPPASTFKATTADADSLFDNDNDVEMDGADVSALGKRSRESLDIETMESLSIDEGHGKHGSGVPPTRFYGTKKGKEKEIAPPPESAMESPLQIESEKEESEIETEDVVAKTAIFTLDSLSSKPGKAAGKLQQYLKREAKDKKDFGEIRDATCKPALVPVQPNHSDCGIYLLHFAETFIRDPEKFRRIICTSKKPKYTQKQAKIDWNHAEVEGKRDQLMSTILGKSEEWKSVKEAQMKRDLAEGKVPEKVDADDGHDSDVDIIGDVKAKPSPVKLRPKAKPVSKSAKSR